MDTLEDKEVKGIWERVKRYINPEDIKAKTREELENEIKKQMSIAGKSKNQGSIDILLNRGFATRISKEESVQKDYIVGPEGKRDAVIENQEKNKWNKDQLPDMEKVRQRKGNKIAIKVKGKFRTYSENTTRVTRGSYKGRAAYFVYNTRLKKRLTWGFIR